MAEENEVGTPEEVEGDAGQSGNESASPEENVQEAAAVDSDGGEQPDAAVDPDAVMAEMDNAVDQSAEGEAVDDNKVVNDDDASEDDAEAAMLAMLEELPSEENAATPDDIDFGSATAAPAEFQQLTAPAGDADAQNIDLLLDVNLPVSIELGRTKMSIEEILSLGPGSVVELAKLAGEPVDLLVNYKIVARGEVVVIDENFGVRVTQLLSPEERLKALGEQ